ncbi:methyltransferase domain-containing protein [Glycomyces terrestris]|uniref:Methyltransferase domain-containing protein n=1 Tax=Glycomyces terrestris TaxID=2493553 RepID=A0A426V4K4_9ACTN|nr:methyltransferase domain-containing protein [Glycomyces terrestris]RRS01792.1 methyltransferase domain-containing protein [Glycomyces terrestris]
MTGSARSSDWGYGELSARVYELDKPVGRSLNGDVEFYTRRLAGITGEILEPAVGTGRMLVPLLQQGLRVTGFDTSEHMLRICRANLAAAGLEARVFTADMTEYAKPGAYEAILVPTGSIILLPDRAATVRALRRMHESLRPGGRLFVDVPPPRLLTGPGGLRHWQDGESELLTLQTMHIDLDEVAQRVVRWLRYELWRDGRLVDTQLQNSGMLCFGVQEFRHLLREAGFTDAAVYGDYDETAALAANASTWNFEAVKA